jgi:hypothetical protein
LAQIPFLAFLEHDHDPNEVPMNDTAAGLLKDLERSALFAQVGTPVESDSVLTVESWKEASKRCRAREAKYAWGEALNVLSDELRPKDLSRYRLWNEIASEARDKVKSLLMPQIERVSNAQKFGTFFANTVVGDFVGACIELAYADLVPPRFFAAITKWYLAGHWPCGWEGEYPEGRLIIF